MIRLAKKKKDDMSMDDIKDKLIAEIKGELSFDDVLGGSFKKVEQKKGGDVGESLATSLLYLVHKLGAVTEYTQREVKDLEYIKMNPLIYKFAKGRGRLKQHLSRKHAKELMGTIKNISNAVATEYEHERQESFLKKFGSKIKFWK